MDLSYDLNNVVESLVQKLAGAEKRASELEAVVLKKEERINDLEKELQEMKEDGSCAE